jgi:2-amino-4-hydroxy-6-hydroxymethyldihydropteridine diphosphokinase
MSARALDLPAWAVVKPERKEHIARVAALMESWAQAAGLGAEERARRHRAAVLHDALRDADPETLRGPVGEDARLPQALWHGPAAAALAERHGEKDAGVLAAVRWHTLGWREWDEVGRALYLADYLEPGRTHDADRAALAARVPQQFDAVLREVAARRVGWLLRTGKPIARQTWDFWNGLVAGDSSSW